MRVGDASACSLIDLGVGVPCGVLPRSVRGPGRRSVPWRLRDVASTVLVLLGEDAGTLTRGATPSIRPARCKRSIALHRWRRGHRHDRDQRDRPAHGNISTSVFLMAVLRAFTGFRHTETMVTTRRRLARRHGSLNNGASETDAWVGWFVTSRASSVPMSASPRFTMPFFTFTRSRARSTRVASWPTPCPPSRLSAGRRHSRCFHPTTDAREPGSNRRARPAHEHLRRAHGDIPSGEARARLLFARRLVQDPGACRSS